jgi:preprotein translocase subunit SecG
MIILITVIHVIVCLFLIIVVLLQSGKAADLAGAFGGMGSQTAFGPRGSATLLSKATTISAIVFMLTSLGLSIATTRYGSASKTVLDRHEAAQPATKKGGPAPATVPGSPVSQPPATGAPGGAPSVSLGTEGGKAVTIPLDLPTKQGEPAQKSAPPAAPQKK